VTVAVDPDTVTAETVAEVCCVAKPPDSAAVNFEPFWSRLALVAAGV
jgi:hypothetical protein